MNAVERSRLYRQTRDELREEAKQLSPSRADLFIKMYENGGRNVLGTVKRMRVGLLTQALSHAKQLNEGRLI